MSRFIALGKEEFSIVLQVPPLAGISAKDVLGNGQGVSQEILFLLCKGPHSPKKNSHREGMS